jgi:hypothetical protein
MPEVNLRQELLLGVDQKGFIRSGPTDRINIFKNDICFILSPGFSKTS